MKATPEDIMPTNITPPDLDILTVLATQASLRHIQHHGNPLLRRIQALGQDAFQELDRRVFVNYGHCVGSRVRIEQDVFVGQRVYEILDYVVPDAAMFPWFVLGVLNKDGSVGKRRTLEPLNGRFQVA